MKLTPPQRALVRELPDDPSEGQRCRGPRYRVAEALVRLGLARRLGAPEAAGPRLWGMGGSYLRTPQGRTLAEALAKKEETDDAVA